MKLGISSKRCGFTLPEMTIAIGVGTIILAATVTASVALQKSFAQVDNYSATHTQQVRIVDYLARDVRRGLSVTSSVDLQTVTIAIPKYIIQAGDPEASANPSLIGTPRAPIRTYDSLSNSGDPLINYEIPGYSSNTVQYKVNGSSIERWEENKKAGSVAVKTTIASSTDNLVPQTTDVELANTEYTTTAVTFKPISVASRGSTVVYSTAYLRNRRRPPPAVPTPTP